MTITRSKILAPIMALVMGISLTPGVYGQEGRCIRGDVQGFGMGIAIGYQPTILNLKPYNLAGVTEQPKPSGMSLDLIVKYKWNILYARSGLGYTFISPLLGNGSCRTYFHCFPFERGRNPQITPKDYGASYIKIPMIGGLTFPILDQGAIQFGIGGLFASGSQTYEFKNSSNDTELSGSSFGLMFQLAFEKKMTPNLVLTLEFNIIENRSSALKPEGSNSKYLVREIDFSGTEFLLGFGYFF